MKRKLVPYEVFAQMRENSTTNVVKELIEAEDHLARALDVESLKLSSFNDSQVFYEQADGTYLQANYIVENGHVRFENIEQLVIDEQSEREAGKQIIRNMLESVLEDNHADANKSFDQYLDLTSKRYQRDCDLEDNSLDESYARLYGSKARTKGKGKAVISYRPGSKNAKKAEAAKLGHRRHPSSYRRGVAKRKRGLSGERSRRKSYKTVQSRLKALNSGNYKMKKKMNEWLILAENVFGYLDFSNNSHVNVVINENQVILPDSEKRNEARVLKMQHDHMLKTDVKILRENAKRLGFNQEFCQAVADVKRYNNISDAKQLEESIETLIRKFSSVLYLTENEMTKTVAYALASVGVNNYDDEICKFLAEGILRGAHHIYSERVERILKLSGNKIDESDDKYADFQSVANVFFQRMDETFQMEVKMFEDLCEAVIEIRDIAIESKNEAVRNEAQDFITELEGVINGQMNPNMELATDVASWLETIVESNEWDVVKTPHQTVTGDHPDMARNAKVSGHPYLNGSHYGDGENGSPMIGSDSMDVHHGDDARMHSWGNKGGKDVYPDLTNPEHKPAPDFKINGEKAIDDDEGFADMQGEDMVPNLKNPYLVASWIPPEVK